MASNAQDYYNSSYDAAYYPQEYGGGDAQGYYAYGDIKSKQPVTRGLSSRIHVPTIRGLGVFILAGFLIGGAVVAAVISTTGGLTPEVISAAPSERYEKLEDRVCSGRTILRRNMFTDRMEPVFVSNPGEIVTNHPDLVQGSTYIAHSSYGGSYNNDRYDYETFIEHAKTICGAIEGCDGINVGRYGNEYGFNFVAAFVKEPSSICLLPKNLAVFEDGPYLNFGDGKPEIDCFLKEGVREKYVTPTPGDVC